MHRRSRHPDLWRCADGQAILFVVLVLFTLICLIGLTINVGHRVSRKIELQNAADAAAISGAIWIARGLNLISILNVSLTEVLAFIIFLEAIKKGNDMLPIVWGVNYGIATAMTAFPPTAAAGSIWLQGLNRVSSSVFSVYPQLNQRIGSHDQGGTMLATLWDLMDIIADAERAIQNLPPVMALANAQEIGELNGADLTLLLPATFELPVIEGEFSDLCYPTKEDGGGPGYENFLCWDGGALSMPPSAVGLPNILPRLKDLFRTLWLVYPSPTTAPDLAPLVPPISTVYGLLVDAAYGSICGGSSTVNIEMQTSDCQECADNDGRDIAFVGYRCQIDAPNVDAACISPEDDEGERTYNRFQDAQVEFGALGFTQRTKPPDTTSPTAQGACSFYRLQTDSRTIVDANTGQETTIIEYFKTEWVMSECTFDSTEAVSVGAPPDPPTPLMIDPDWLERSEYLALSTMAVGDKVTYTGVDYESPNQAIILGDAGERQTLSVAQAKVYNATGADLFNQDWRVRLVPVDLDELNTDITQFLGQYPIFEDALGLFLSH
ncbi:MAG: pilus assembly protein TadG-related protein [Desulfosarcinaceae bacterium]|nr:pilus assembly protein TadG-related protein [Desulfosarcinaceae bacterium]